MKSKRRILFVLIISSVFILLLATPLSILTVNAQPPPTAGQQQQQQQQERIEPPPQATQTSPPLLAQENMTQLNQSAPLVAQQSRPNPAPLTNMTQLNQSAPPPQATQTSPPLLAQENMTQLNQSAPQQIAPLNQLVGSEDFAASGTINSTLYTTNGNWEAIGIWTLSVSEGEIASFETDMAWNNGTAAHTHEFQNFEMDEDSDDISINSEGGITIEGDMDVGTNGVVSWPNVPAEIIIQQGKIITVSVDHDETDNHFGGQSVHGTVTSLTPCSASPGANMQISAGAC